MAAKLRVDQVKEKIFFPLLVGVVYLILFLTLEYASHFYETLPSVHGWYPVAGLTLALLLAFGPAYAGFAVIGQILADVWIRPLSAGLGDLLLFACGGAVVYAAAYLLGRFSTNARNDLRSSKAFGRFLAAALGTAVLLSVVNSLNLLISGLVFWQQISRAILVGAIGAGSGILGLSPFLLTNILPFSESFLHGLGGRRAASIRFRSSHGECATTISADWRKPSSSPYYALDPRGSGRRGSFSDLHSHLCSFDLAGIDCRFGECLRCKFFA